MKQCPDVFSATADHSSLATSAPSSLCRCCKCMALIRMNRGSDSSPQSMIPLKYVCACKSLNVPQSFSRAVIGVCHAHLIQFLPTDHSDWMLQRRCSVYESLSGLYHSQPTYVQQSQALPADHSDWIPQRQCTDCGSLSGPYHFQPICE